MDVGSIKGKIELSNKEFKDSIEEAKAKAKTLSQEMNGINSILRDVGLNSSQIQKINDELKKANPKILEQQIEDVRKKLIALGADSKQIEKVTNEIKKADAGLKEMEITTDQLGVAFLALGAAVTAVIGKTVHTAAQFEQSMARVRAVTGATAMEFDMLRKSAADMGATTVFSASQAAEAQSFLAMAGFKSQQIIAALPGVLNLAAAGQMDLARTADIASNILTGFGLSAEQTDRVVDVMAKTMTTANTDIGQLGYAMKQVAPTAKTLGMSIEETAAAVAKLSDAGIQGESAGTALRAILLSIIDPSTEAGKMMDKLGISIKDTRGELLPFADVIGNFETAFSRLTDAQKGQVASTIVGREATSAFLELISKGKDALSSYTDELRNAAGTAQNIADIQNDTLNGAIKQFQSALEAASITVGDNFAPAVRAATEELTRIALGFENMSGPAQNAILAFTTLTTVTGILTTSFYALRAAAISLQASFPVLLGLSLAIGGVAAALTYANSEVDKVTVSFDAQTDAGSRLTRQAIVLQEELDGLTEETTEYNRVNGHLQSIYDQILATNPDLKKGWEEQGRSMQWLQGEVRKLSAEYVAMQKNAFAAANAAIQAQLTQKMQARSNARSEIALFDGKDVDDNIRRQIEYKRQEEQLLKADIVGLQQQQFALWKQENNLLKPVSAAEVMTQLEAASASSGGGGGGGQTIDFSDPKKAKAAKEKKPKTPKTKTPEQLAQDAYQTELSLLNARHQLRKAQGEDEEKLLQEHIVNLNKLYDRHKGYLAKHEQEKLQLFTQTANAENDLRQVQQKKEHERYKHSLAWIEEKKKFGELSLSDELAAWERVHARQIAGTDEQKRAAYEIHRLKKELAKAEFDHSVKWIEEKKYFDQLSLQEEYDAWKRVHDRYLEGSDERKKAARELYRVQKEMLKEYAQEAVKLFKAQQDSHIEYLTKKHADAIKTLENNLKSIEDSYNRQIKAQEEKLKLLDEEYQKEDRLKRLRDLDEQKEKIMSDRRYEKILEDGTKILTYNEAAVAEIDKQRSELVEQYEREDVKQSIRNEIDRLKTAKDEKVSVMKAEIESVKESNKQELELAKSRWEKLVKAAEEGTLSFDALMSGENGWYAKAIGDLKGYVDGVEAQMAKLRALYDGLRGSGPSIRSGAEQDVYSGWESMTANGSTNTVTYGGGGTGYYDSSTGNYGFDFRDSKYHTGGIAGIRNFRSPFTLQPDEIMAVLQKGEPVLQAGQIRSLTDYITSQTTNGDTIHIGNVTVNANNAEEFWRSLYEYRRAIRS